MTPNTPLPTDSRFLKLQAGDPLVLPVPPSNRPETSQEIADRTIPAAWLKLLSQGHLRTVSVPIQISNAIFDTFVDLQYVTFNQDVSFFHCDFHSSVNLAFATFHNAARFARSHFHGSLSLRAAHVDKDFDFLDVKLDAIAVFQDMHVVEVFDARGTVFSQANFQRIEVGKDTLFGLSTSRGTAPFNGDADFQSGHFAGTVEFNGVEFMGNATFAKVFVGGDLYFRTNDDKHLLTFHKEASFLGAHVAGTVDFSGVHFTGSAALDNLHVDGDIYLRNDDFNRRTTFHDKASFLGAQIQGNAELDGAVFKKHVYFNRFHVGRGAFFRADKQGRGVSFEDSVSFLAAEFCLDAQFSKVKFSAGVVFDNVQFKGPAQFASAEFAPGCSANFIGTKFERGVDFDSARFLGKTDFTASVTDRDVRFSQVRFAGPVSFREAKLQSIFFGESAPEERQTWWFREPKPRNATTWDGQVDFRGLTYDRIYAYLPDILPRLTPFDRQPYSQLESALRKTGDDQRARNVYAARRNAERKNKWDEHRFFAWIADWLYKLVANSGIAPLRLVPITIALLLVGAFFFAQTNALEPAKDATPAQAAAAPSPLACKQATFLDGLAVSVHYFLPMEVPVGADCKPVSTRIPAQVDPSARLLLYHILPSPAWYAAIFLRLFGGILVGIGLAAITGLLRRIAQ